MPRPKCRRRLRFQPQHCFFKPRGLPLRQLQEVVIEADELEALKLHDVDGLSHTQAAEKMQVSQPTFGRILNKTYHKLAQALVKGQAIKLLRE